MGDSRSWAAEKEDEITTCKHGHESKYFDRCMCDGCVSDRSVQKYRDGLKNKCVNHFSEWLDRLELHELEAMSKKADG